MAMEQARADCYGTWAEAWQVFRIGAIMNGLPFRPSSTYAGRVHGAALPLPDGVTHLRRGAFAPCDGGSNFGSP
eukprot:8899086-Heterocapsa_arctica.AAC.1